MTDTGQPPTGGQSTSWANEMNEEDTRPAAAATTLSASAAAPSSTAQAGSTMGRGRSWASVLGGGLPFRVDNNVLEVTLEKNARGSFTVNEAECAHMMGKLGLDHVHVEGVQICPQGRGVIFITLKKQVDIARFCRYEVLEVTMSGIRAVLVKPAGQREVVITAKGIHPNTGDEAVLN